MTVFISVYNSPPAQPTKKTEGKKTKFEAAEYDEEFFERINEMDYDDFLAHLQSLPEVERKALMQAIDRALSQRLVHGYLQWLTGVGSF